MKSKERGQALVIVVIAIVALVAAVGLAIDGGRNHSERRQAQNAADAAVMAGTRILADYIVNCADGSVANDNTVAAALVDLARQNGVDHFAPNADVQAWYVDMNETRLGQVGWGGGIPNGATGIEATLVVTEPATFMRVVGREDIVAAGHAMAMAGPINYLGGGMLPIGVPLEVVNALEEDEHFHMMDNVKKGGGGFCRDMAGTDCIGDPSTGADTSNRGWLNFNYIYNTEHRTADDPLNRSFEQSVPNRGCGSEPGKSVDDGLQGWAGDGCPYPFPIFAGGVGMVNGDFIHGDPGARQSSLREVIETYNGTIAYVPIFDTIYTSDYMDEHFTAPQEPPDGSLGGKKWPSAGGGGSAYLYHIVGFAAVRIDDSKLNDHILEGNFTSAIVGDGEISPSTGLGGGGACDSGLTLFGVKLWQ